MKSEVKTKNQHNMVITLIICGGPIGKGNGKTIVQAVVTDTLDKNQTKVETEKGKKSPSVNKTK
ncbi:MULTISPECIES: hypothetical protein [Sphingobacterium]|jgi:hypothetical protein|uniref:Uncharacterized protein n=1 Tax=Sphingobacterium siyangense TaxID=459529 RepID=A0A420FWF7_9SPHI|nr:MULTISPECIES: hypothetical protein [Sphingobacterium]RKF37280.1 hypothetical protein BCY89_06465 [Sphingobacterium siyangense]TWI25521.1 hypothetical protein IQ31_00086 [Sphingobacterium siyangense]